MTVRASALTPNFSSSKLARPAGPARSRAVERIPDKYVKHSSVRHGHCPFRLTRGPGCFGRPGPDQRNQMDIRRCQSRQPVVHRPQFISAVDCGCWQHESHSRSASSDSSTSAETNIDHLTPLSRTANLTQVNMPLSHLQTLLYQGSGDFPTEVGHPSSLKKAVVYLNPKALVHPNEPPVSDLIYSGFLEHLGRCIYGGIVDNVKAPSPSELLIKQDHGEGITKGRAGWRKDVMDVIGKKGELEIPVLRWPGGE